MFLNFLFHVCMGNVHAFLEMCFSRVSILLKSDHCVKGTIMDTLIKYKGADGCCLLTQEVYILTGKEDQFIHPSPTHNPKAVLQ